MYLASRHECMQRQLTETERAGARFFSREQEGHWRAFIVHPGYKHFYLRLKHATVCTRVSNSNRLLISCGMKDAFIVKASPLGHVSRLLHVAASPADLYPLAKLQFARGREKKCSVAQRGKRGTKGRSVQEKKQLLSWLDFTSLLR